ncbi:hypothetical protein HBK87_21690 [Streptomyces sp. 2BBP-J2]|uniref:DUF6082 family protein n=1 Tax=Streptomyces sp. 2BBP-J2 TaxID=2719381 RepID=UPI001431DDC5|nr:DUF6082 family protein [Streptomyces sp. 2BBP-J2]NIL53152.1 hypothetical protein [Streptomyces sp. 2BBP-J2]
MGTQSYVSRGLGAVTRVGIAFSAGIVTAIAVHRALQEGSRDRDRRSRGFEQAGFAQQQQLQLYLLDKALADPDLAAVLSTVEAESPTQRRQFLFANALYSNTLLAYRIGLVSLEELHGYLRITCQNPIFRAYWEATRHHRASLVDTSDEARVGRMVDALIADLDEAETEQWWVVGVPTVADEP